MRIRTIKPEFFRHDGLFDAERDTGLPLRIAYVGVWCVADREGRFKWEPRRLGVEILPYDGVDFSRVLDALATRGFIEKYEVGGAFFGVVPSFRRHQIVNNRERASELPKPPGDQHINGACPTGDARDGDAGKAEGNRELGKEGGTESTRPRRAPPTTQRLFPGELQKLIESARDDLYALTHPGGCPYPTKLTGDKEKQARELTERIARLKERLEEVAA